MTFFFSCCIIVVYDKIGCDELKYEIPKDANPSFTANRIYPKDKVERSKWLSSKEKGEFSGVCKLGADQLISCYQYEDEGYSKQDFLLMCKDCNYSLCRKSSYDYQTSISEPFFIEKEFSDFLATENIKPKYFVYFISDGDFVKIGVTNNIKLRLSELQVGNARKLDCICLIPAKNRNSAFSLEHNLHDIYERYYINGEWFDLLKFLDVDEFRDIYNPGFVPQVSKAVNILFNREMYEKIKEEADEKLVDASALIRSIIDDWYKKHGN